MRGDPFVETRLPCRGLHCRLHTRVQLTPEGDFRILDAGSVAGTWVNYAPVPPQGLLLKHGDLVQIGRESFRFQLARPPEESQLKVETGKDLE